MSQKLWRKHVFLFLHGLEACKRPLSSFGYGHYSGWVILTPWIKTGYKYLSNPVTAQR
jgi:hypothetical protein